MLACTKTEYPDHAEAAEINDHTAETQDTLVDPVDNEEVAEINYSSRLAHSR